MVTVEQPRISIDPKVCHGKPVISGTRVLVANILGALATGQSRQSILQDYPSIREADIDAALEFIQSNPIADHVILLRDHRILYSKRTGEK